MSDEVAQLADALRRMETRLSILSERMESRMVPVEKDLGLIHEDLRLLRKDFAEVHRMLLNLMPDDRTPPMGVKTGGGGS